jgi:hypothetical protein
MNKSQKASIRSTQGKTMSESEWEYATDKYKEFRKSRQMKKAEFKEHKSIIAEGKFSKSLIDKAIKIAKKSSGQMTKAFTAIEKLAKGLGDDPTVSNALRLANEQKYIPGESVTEGKKVNFKTFRENNEHTHADGTTHRHEGGDVKHTHEKVEAKSITEGKNLMPAFQDIVDNKQAKKIGGVMVDMFTASVLTKAYGKVNDSNKKKMESSDLKTLVALAQRVMGMKEAVEFDSAFLAEAKGKYRIDHKTFSGAVQEAMKLATKSGYEVDEDDYFNSIATGPRKPSEGKTNSYKIALTKKGKEQKKLLQIQIYGKGKHGFELNCYIA